MVHKRSTAETWKRQWKLPTDGDSQEGTPSIISSDVEQAIRQVRESGKNKSPRKPRAWRESRKKMIQLSKAEGDQECGYYWLCSEEIITGLGKGNFSRMQMAESKWNQEQNRKRKSWTSTKLDYRENFFENEQNRHIWTQYERGWGRGGYVRMWGI